jgi:hypothetical protein
MGERHGVIDPLLLGVTRIGGRLSRNNSGIAYHKDGSVVRYGLFAPGGADTIGWMPLTVRQEHLGQTLAIFTAIEAKTGQQRPDAQQRAFLQLVNGAGGIGLWGTSASAIIEDLKRRM